MDTDLGQHRIETPPASQRNLADSLSDPRRVQRNIEAHRECLRKLATAAACAVSTGATWAEMVDAVRAGVTDSAEVGRPSAVLSATARARIHDGNDAL